MTAETIPAPLDALIATDRKPLDAHDRCDACGAQAYLAAVVNRTELLYCGHHANKYEENLFLAASSWHDERASLLNAA
ncbi:DUF7455 domain-containing protein [Microbacterium xylanilyticum]